MRRLFLLCCILSKFHIKPQRLGVAPGAVHVVSYRNSTSNHNLVLDIDEADDVVSYRNSTSNHNNTYMFNFTLTVVSYRNSTSNHNENDLTLSIQIVVSYRNSTSNHNLIFAAFILTMLYLIEIPHQTTTVGRCSWCCSCCILSKFHIKPQLGSGHRRGRRCCILSKFHIKPQQHVHV